MKVKSNLFSFESLVFAIYILLYFFFALGLLLKWVVACYFLGILMLFCIFYNLVHPLFTKGRIKGFIWFDMLITFISFVVILSIYISVIPYDNFRTAVLTISASSVGGLLTLLGVGLTIKYARIDKEEDEIKRAKPNVFPVSQSTWLTIPKDKINTVFVNISKNSDLKPVKRENANYYLRFLKIANSDMTMCTISGILINGLLVKFEYEQILLKNSFNEIIIDSYFNIDEPVTSIDFVLEDVYHNLYRAITRFEFIESKDKKIKPISIKSVFDITKTQTKHFLVCIVKVFCYQNKQKIVFQFFIWYLILRSIVLKRRPYELATFC